MAQSDGSEFNRRTSEERRIISRAAVRWPRSRRRWKQPSGHSRQEPPRQVRGALAALASAACLPVKHTHTLGSYRGRGSSAGDTRASGAAGSPVWTPPSLAVNAAAAGRLPASLSGLVRPWRPARWFGRSTRQTNTHTQ